MRPEPAPPEQAALQLLAHADALALAATEAIAAGDDVAVAALLEERGIVVAAAIQAVQQVQRAGVAGDDLVARLTGAVRDSIRSGEQVRGAALRARDHVATELAVLDARHQASLEYQQGGLQATINVVL
jgi:translation elongation factor EF-Tu-like GTPase